MHPLAATLQGAAAAVELASPPAARALQAASNLVPSAPAAPMPAAPPPASHGTVWGVALLTFCAGLAFGWHMRARHDRH